MSNYKNYTFEVELIFEPSGDAMVVSVDFETDDPDGIIGADWPNGFAETILSNISIVPISYDE